MDPAPEVERKGRQLKPFEKKLIALVIVLVVVIAGFSVFYYLQTGDNHGKTLVVYTYSSFMAYGLNKTAAYNAVFGTFEKEYGVNIVVRTPAQGLLPTLEAQKGNPQADIVIGLTNVNGIQAVQNGLLVKYRSPATEDINSTLMDEMGMASAFLTPYEYSYLGIDYNKTHFTGNFVPSFSDLARQANATNMLLENPATSETGQEFLLWEIAYYQYLMNENWTSWWSSVKPYTTNHIYDSWSTAFSQFESANASSLLVSYQSDPAYNDYFGYGNFTGSTVTSHAGLDYGWRTIYNIGIVNGSANIGLDEAFINYFLGPTVQNLIPTNEWMYPANTTIHLPSVYNTTTNPSGIIPLNRFLNATAISMNLQTWDVEWINTME
ncbi:MAG: thiamine ABC transporter substrate-binding protein [Candidatus Thermoplasmatota archaeon]|jgi:thiamine transport system substrate-binding protein|nr:thiamine ABC transporter substrate-binding protein [Candidatus Thermoplasmatota archaeon]